MNKIAPLLLLPLLAVTWPALACKILVRYPAHLEPSAQERGLYYVVAIKSQSQSHYTAQIVKSFGGSLQTAESTVVRFSEGEEAHAICPIQLLPGQTYLLRTVSRGKELEVSRYNWLNVASTHERFDGYVEDLSAVK